jgi:hypothetical protein
VQLLDGGIVAVGVRDRSEQPGERGDERDRFVVGFG